MNDSPPLPVDVSRGFVADMVSRAWPSPIVALGCLGFLTIGSVVRRAPHASDAAAVVYAVCVSIIVGLAAFIVVAAISQRLRLRVAVVAAHLGAFALAEIARTVAFDALVVGFPVGPELGLAIIAGGLTGVTVIGGVSAVANGARRYREQFAQLSAARAELAENLARAHFESRLDTQRLIQRTQEVLGGAFRDALEKGAQSGDAAGAVLRLVDSSIRPLSRQLDRAATESFSTVDHDAGLVQTRRLPPLLVVRSSVGRDAFDPRPMLVAIVLLTLGTVVFSSAPGGPVRAVLWLLAILATVGVPMFVAHRALGPHLPRMSLAARLIITGTVYVVVIGSAATVDQMARPSATESDVVYVGLLGVLLLTMIATLRGLAIARVETLSELAKTNARSRLLAARATAVLWSEQRELARAVHRDVQAAAIAAAWRYSNDLADPQRSREALRVLQQAIEESVARLSVDPTVPTIGVIAERARDTWACVCSLDVRIAPDLARRLDDDASTRRVLAELLTEFVTNAVKHGRAQRAVADITEVNDACLEFRFWNNGLPVDPQAAAGLGFTEILRQSLAFRARNLDHGVEFHVCIGW